MNGNNQQSLEHDLLAIQITPLQIAICNSDFKQVEKIISKLDVDQLRHELIRSRLDSVSTLSSALLFDRTRRIATFILRFVVQPEKLSEDTVLSWFELFELTEKMYRHFKSHLTAKRMAQEMLGIRPYIHSGELVLNDLVIRPKFFKAAWMLGAKYVPKHVGDSFASYVYWSHDIPRPDKRKLFDWMERVGMYQYNPFDIEAQAELVAERNPDRCEYLMGLPREKECDEQGYNLFHWAAYKGRLSFYRAKRYLRYELNYPNAAVVDMLMQKNVFGVTPLAICLIRYAPGRFLLFPTAVHRAIRKVVETGALDLIEPVFSSHLVTSCKPLFFYLYSLEVTSNKFLKAVEDGWFNLFEEEMVMTHANYDPPSELDAMEAYDPTAPPFKMNELLPELVYEIAMLLSPEDAFSLFAVSQKMTKLLKRSNELFWTKYHSLHYRPLSAPCPSFKQRVIHEVRGRSNWQSNKHHDLVLKKYHYSRMDDNWIILQERHLIDTFSSRISPLPVESYFYFNCHTQQIIEGFSNTPVSAHPTLILSNYNYITTPGPVYFNDGLKDRYGNHDYRIVRGQEVIDCKAVQEFMVGRPQMHNFYINYKLIDHRMFISERSAIYDPECDKITGQLSTEPKFYYTAEYGTYLPYSKQIYRISNVLEPELYDLNYKRVATLPGSLQYLSGPQQIDEHTLFYYGRSAYGYRPGFLDLRMNQFVEFLDGHIQRSAKAIASLNGERIVFSHPMLRIITSWNLRTRRWEFVDDNWFFPDASNLRYLVGTHGEDVIVRDYCSNAIKYN